MSHSPNDPKAGKPMADSEQSPNGGFLGRWARRKQSDQAETEAEITDELVVADSDTTIVTVADPVADDAEIDSADNPPVLTDDDMPPIESLSADSDYSPFLSEGVSKKLRNLALKKLFFSGKFAIRDGLDDYDDDFTNFEPLGDIVTSDMKFHERRKEKARLAKLEEERLQEEERLEQEAKNKLAGQQQDEDDESDEGDENAPGSSDPEVIADESDPASVTADGALAQSENSGAMDIANAGLHGSIRAGDIIADDKVELSSPHAKLKKVAHQSTQEEADTGLNKPSDETKRDQT